MTIHSAYRAISFAELEAPMNEHDPPRKHQPHADDNLAVVKRLFDAFGRRDIAAVLGELTDFVHLIALRHGRVARFQEFFDTYAAAEAFRP